MRRFFRFSIRDLLWLTLVVALALGWFVHQRRLRADAIRAQLEAIAAHEQANEWCGKAHRLERSIEGIMGYRAIRAN